MNNPTPLNLICRRATLDFVLEADIEDEDGPSLLQDVDYAYDPFNQLIRRTLDADGDGSGTATEQFFSYQNGQVALQFDSTTATVPSHRYLWGPTVDLLMADEQTGSATVLWPLADQVGTIRDLATHNSTTDATTIENHRTYDSYGNLISETNAAIDLIFGFTGRQLDEATGLQYNLNRWYDAKTGRWTSEDPIGFEGDQSNLYRYVDNNPLSFVDPFGTDKTHPYPPRPRTIPIPPQPAPVPKRLPGWPLKLLRVCSGPLVFLDIIFTPTPTGSGADVMPGDPRYCRPRWPTNLLKKCVLIGSGGSGPYGKKRCTYSCDDGSQRNIYIPVAPGKPDCQQVIYIP